MFVVLSAMEGGATVELPEAKLRTEADHAEEMLTGKLSRKKDRSGHTKTERISF